jgi:hypothetical protein
MAITLSKRFIRSISQPFDHSQTGHSLWTLGDIEDKQKRDKEEMERSGGFEVEDQANVGAGGNRNGAEGQESLDEIMEHARNGGGMDDEDEEMGYDRQAVEDQAAMEALANEPIDEDDM